jgi:hypothetical protein
LSHSVLALAGELSVVAGCEAGADEAEELLAPEEAGAEPLLEPAGAEAADEPVAEPGEPPLLLLPLHAETDSAAVSASTAPV